MKYYSQYHSHELFELQESLSGLSKSNRWVKLADNLPWDKIEQEYNKRLKNRHYVNDEKKIRDAPHDVWHIPYYVGLFNDFPSGHLT